MADTDTAAQATDQQADAGQTAAQSVAASATQADAAKAGQGTVTDQQADTAKAGEAKDGDAAKQDGQEAKKDEAPETYAEFTLPEGMQADKAELDDFVTFAKEHKLSQEAAQALVDRGAKLVQKAVDGQREAWAKTLEGWVQTVKTDKEIGGTEMEQRVGVAKKALERFGTPELIKALDETGLGNHPELVRFAYRVGKAVSEDTLVSGRSASGQVDPASTLFPTMKKGS